VGLNPHQAPSLPILFGPATYSFHRPAAAHGPTGPSPPLLEPLSSKRCQVCWLVCHTRVCDSAMSQSPSWFWLCPCAPVQTLDSFHLVCALPTTWTKFVGRLWTEAHGEQKMESIHNEQKINLWFSWRLDSGRCYYPTYTPSPINSSPRWPPDHFSPPPPETKRLNVATSFSCFLSHVESPLSFITFRRPHLASSRCKPATGGSHVAPECLHWSKGCYQKLIASTTHCWWEHSTSTCL
jgi:hypothetical protein